MKELTSEQISAFLAKQIVGHVGMIRSGRPYIVPVGYMVDQHTVYFATGPGEKLASLQQEAETCFEVDEFVPELGEYRSVIAYGHARVVDDPAERTRILRALIGRFEREAPAMARSRDYPAHAMSRIGSNGDEPDLTVVALPLDEVHGREAT